MKSQVRVNAEKDQNYKPYCMRCRGLVRMQRVAPFFWRCTCGAEHDEREPYLIRFTETVNFYGKDQPPVVNGPFVIRGNAASIYRVLIHLGTNPCVHATIHHADDSAANLEAFYEDITRDQCDMSGMPYPDFLTMVNRTAGK